MVRAKFGALRAQQRDMVERGKLSAAIAGGLIAAITLPTAAAGAELVRATDGVAIDAASGLGAEPLLVRLAAGDAVELFGHALRSERGARIYVARGNDYQKWAFVVGTATFDGRAMKAGDAAAVSLASGKVDRRRFDAARLAASAPPGVAAELSAPLSQLAAQQHHQRFWGRLGGVGTGPSATAAAGENVRRDYLNQDAVAALRSEKAGDPAALERRVASRFAAAAAAGDIDTTASLLDPAPFVAGGPGWLTIRRDFAAAMTARLRAGPDTAAPAAGAPGTVVDIAGRPYALQFAKRDGFPFVSAVAAAR